jgi:hypothetical protein
MSARGVLWGEVVRGVAKVVQTENSVATGIVAPSSESRGLTSLGAKNYAATAAREGSARNPATLLPSRFQAAQCQGRRPFKEFFQ